jgi:hypothetical protein
MRDFTSGTLQQLLSTFISEGYTITTMAGFIRHPVGKCVILRHDIDARPMNALKCARLENKMGITGTYYFRAKPGSLDESVIMEIHRLGHEIGYHYEELSSVHGDYMTAIRLFEQNLAKLRRLVPVETICMHGSPMSKYDNRKLWKKYDYRDFGIIGEPYLDIDFREVLYLTDTGRRWDGERYSIRDRVPPAAGIPLAGEAEALLKYPVCHTTFDIIDAVITGQMPSGIMVTFHPQRWNDNPLPWLKELVWQNIKNAGKGLINRMAIEK